MKKNLISIKPGRPKGPIKCRNANAREFFRLVDRLGLTLGEVVEILNDELSDSPSYRTLQEWRRGTHEPRYISFDEWKKIIEGAKEN